MYLTGYHGTNKEASDRIMESGKFLISKGDKQWLGDGIYFYPNFGDAYNWKYRDSDPEAEIIIHAIIKIEDDEYLEIDSNRGLEIFRKLSDEISKGGGIESKGAERNLNAVCKMIWEKCEKVKVLSANFPTEKTVFPTLIDTRIRRKEFCVRNNDNIVYKSTIERGEIHD